MPVRLAMGASVPHPQVVGDLLNAFLAINHPPLPQAGAERAAFCHGSAAVFAAPTGPRANCAAAGALTLKCAEMVSQRPRYAWRCASPATAGDRQEPEHHE